MTEPAAPTLAEQRALLRQRLALQRQLIARRLEPEEGEGETAYPRSRTMRFLTERSGLVLKVAGALLGGRMIGTLTKTYAVVKVLRSFLNAR